ncbi:hypothetical protein G6F57_002772 [Rhizopus arrhizus]|uniref:Uncharacterized protein n=1 Tax=Rhizopus oryzae TaxID=64495 RepID=A0A9P7BX94_RHIOR|nr:hypothetical protein G6F23_001395 [Rhizopus arrhizus]KAG1428686.1 hypothetical protein G6F58_000457 [Rhizopus delemar]KAG0768023.1 hypothetical protein G6F24_002299 [Rhizopus arrhizus]KAG0794580.1 hypothetical protein G6F21_002760 [Rhizopus arrhizus]KAG0801224.1 hypothetical protein G6F22_001459 [Rhizopus arrhizus]
MNFIPTAQQHFITPIFVMAGKHFASILSLLFNYHELDPFTPKQDYEKTITWEIDDQSSLLTMSQYTYLPNSHSAWQHLANNLGQRLGITSILVASPYDTINALYKLLDHLVHSIDQAHATDTCPWWTRVILIIDQAMYEERKLFLTYEMPKIMARYRLSHPLSVLFIDTLHDNPKHSQRILWQMMKKHMLCGRWTYTPQNDNDDDSDSSSDDMYAFATVIEYENGKRKKPPKIEKLNCYPGDDGTSVPQ